MRPGPDVFNGGFVPDVADFVATQAKRAASRGGVAPAHLLDIQTPAGDVFHWSDRPLKAIPAVILSEAEAADGLANYQPWLSEVGDFSFYRSQQTDTGTLRVQNFSGDVLQTDFERIVRRSTLEGSLAVYRYFSVDLLYPWIEFHGTLSVGDSPKAGAAPLSLASLIQGQDDGIGETISETCQLNWGEKRCGATGTTECLYSFGSCQVPEHFMAIQTSYEINNPAAPAQLPERPVNRSRPW